MRRRIFHKLKFYNKKRTFQHDIHMLIEIIHTDSKNEIACAPEKCVQRTTIN